MSNQSQLQVQTGYKQILAMALPITVAIFIPQLNLLTNNVFLGRLGEAELGNAGVTGVYFLIFGISGMGLSNAVQTVLSRYAGANEPDAFAGIMSQAIRGALLYALACILFTYTLAPGILKPFLTAEAYEQDIPFLKIIVLSLPFLYMFQLGNVFLISTLQSSKLLIGFIVQTIFNIFFDYALIFGNLGFPALGFNGAAIATILAEAAGMLTVYFIIFNKGYVKKYNLFKTWAYNKTIAKQITKIAMPLMLQYMLSLSTWLIFFILIEGRGNQAKAVSNPIRTVLGLAGVCVWSFSSTCSAMVSNLIGQQKLAEVGTVIKRICTLSFSLCVVFTLLLNIFPQVFFGLFSQDEFFIAEGIPVLRIVSLGMLIMSCANVCLNAITGIGDTRVNVVIEVVAILLYLIYSYYFVSINYQGLATAWSNEFIYWISILCMSGFYLKKKLRQNG